MNRLRMRTTLLIPLIVLSFGCGVVSLLVIRTVVQRQVSTSLSSDLRRSIQTYQNLRHQRKELLTRESALLASLPPLKALMTTADSRTIEDGGIEFWQLSGSDFFALLDQRGKLVASYNRGPVLNQGQVAQALERSAHTQKDTVLLTLDGRLYEVATQPLWFGNRETGTQLGFVSIGYAIDSRVAQEVSEAAAAEVTFAVGDKIIASTLTPELQQQLEAKFASLAPSSGPDRKIRLGDDEYLVACTNLSGTPTSPDSSAIPILIVAKSFQQASQLIREINRWVLVLTLLTLLVGTAMLVFVSHNLTHPLKDLVEGTRALAQGNFEYRLHAGGVEEVRELSQAFERMQVELRRTQAELIDSERLATIGRMASSISHDLRHYLSAMYANAEFMSDGAIPQAEREDLLEEVRVAVQGMTDLLDSLLLFTQTGRALHQEYQSVDAIVENAASMVRSHPASRNVKISLNGLGSTMAWVDGKKLGRAVYNILLNGCQAARRGAGPAVVTLTLHETEGTIQIQITDNGPGVPEAIRQKIFLPFVSEGRESGVGLGLTLAQQISQEHGGTIELSRSAEGYTVFAIILPKTAIQVPDMVAAKKYEQTQTHIY